MILLIFSDPRLSVTVARRLRESNSVPLYADHSHLQGPLPPPIEKRDLVHKMRKLRYQLSLMQPQTGHCRIEVSRESVFEESYRQIMRMNMRNMRKKLLIRFRGEEGLDYGGIAREWLYILSHEMLNPYYGLFQYSREDVYTLQINRDSGVNPVSIHAVSSFVEFNFIFFVCLVVGTLIVFLFCWSCNWTSCISWHVHRWRLYSALL